jgi:hypothetical protein
MSINIFREMHLCIADYNEMNLEGEMKKITRMALVFCLITIAAGISCSSNSVKNELDHPVTLTPWPPDNYSDLGAHVVLSWHSSDPQGDTLTFDVYFGTTSNPSLISTGQSELRYDPGVLQCLASYFWRVDVRHNHGDPQTGTLWHFSTLNVPPVEPSTPFPVDGATGVGVNTTFYWQDSDPNATDTLTYDLYFGTSSNPPAINTNWRSISLDSQWKMQASARAMLSQIYTMQHAYHQQYDTYCLGGSIMHHWSPNGFALLGLLIDSTDFYTYYMGSTINTFFCSATANIDADATIDTWTIDQDSTLSCTIDDCRLDLWDYSYHPNTTYYWKIVAKDGHTNETIGPIWHFTTGSDSL